MSSGPNSSSLSPCSVDIQPQIPLPIVVVFCVPTCFFFVRSFVLLFVVLCVCVCVLFLSLKILFSSYFRVFQTPFEFEMIVDANFRSRKLAKSLVGYQ